MSKRHIAMAAAASVAFAAAATAVVSYGGNPWLAAGAATLAGTVAAWATRWVARKLTRIYF